MSAGTLRRVLSRAGLALAATAALAGAPAAGAQGVRVAVVNTPRLEAESPTTRRELAALKEEFAQRGQPVQELQQRIAEAQQRYDRERVTLSPSEAQALEREIGEMMRRSNQMVDALNEEYQFRLGQVREKVVREIIAAIEAVAKAGKYDLVLQEAAFARPSIDITEQVLKELARQAGGR